MSYEQCKKGGFLILKGGFSNLFFWTKRTKQLITWRQVGNMKCVIKWKKRRAKKFGTKAYPMDVVKCIKHIRYTHV